MRIADLYSMQMEVEVNENKIIGIREGDTAEIEIDAFVDRTFAGIVSHFGNSVLNQGRSSGAEQVTHFEAEVRILLGSYQDLIDTTRQVATPFRPGMSGMVRIKTEREKNDLTVPILAVTTRPPEGKKGEQGVSRLEEVILLYQKGQAIRQHVTTGIQDNYYIRVKTRLKPGQQVISWPYNVVSKTLKDSTLVKRTTTVQ